MGARAELPIPSAQRLQQGSLAVLRLTVPRIAGVQGGVQTIGLRDRQQRSGPLSRSARGCAPGAGPRSDQEMPEGNLLTDTEWAGADHRFAPAAPQKLGTTID